MGYYKSISRSYNELHSGEQVKKAELILANSNLRGLLLDVGAGTGIGAKTFSEKAIVVSLDPCIELLEKAQGLKVVARAEELPFKNKCFDCVVSITALHHADLPRAFAEIKRVSRENSAICISFFKRAKNIGLAKRIFKNFSMVDEGIDLVFFLGKKDSFGFFGSAFSALVLIPIALFVVFLLVLAYKLKWILPNYALMYFILFLLGFAVVFLILRKKVVNAILGAKKKKLFYRPVPRKSAANPRRKKSRKRLSPILQIFSQIFVIFS